MLFLIIKYWIVLDVYFLINNVGENNILYWICVRRDDFESKIVKIILIMNLISSFCVSNIDRNFFFIVVLFVNKKREIGIVIIIVKY